jgi:hypothetical protein
MRSIPRECLQKGERAKSYLNRHGYHVHDDVPIYIQEERAVELEHVILARHKFKPGNVAHSPSPRNGANTMGRPMQGTEGAKLWLREFLEGGPRSAGDIKRAAFDAGIPKTTLDRAAKLTGVIRIEQSGTPAKLWSMPDAS